MVSLKEKFSHEMLRALLKYDPDTGVLTWNSRGRSLFPNDGAWKSWNTKNAGCRADNLYTLKSKRKTPYHCWCVTIFGKTYRSHRIIWYWMTGEEPPEEIDHKDQDAKNNRWHNIRAATRKENSNNIGLRINNTSGTVGVSLHSSGKWRARIMIDYKEIHLGLFDTKSEAENAVIIARRKYAQRQGDKPL